MLLSPDSSPIKKLLGITLTMAIIVAAYLFVQKAGTSDTYTAQQKNAQQNSADTSNNSFSQNTNSSNVEAKPIPQQFSLTVPFTAQAPTANWDELHNEACEEASAIMVNSYFTGIASLPPVTVEDQIDALTKWQQDTFGYYLSISTEETVKMLEANYNLSAEIITIDEQKIKQALVDNKLIIVPVNGRMLGNPNFTPPGPIYHMFVITGYNGSTIITNDPGTRKGFNYQYSYDTIAAATGNWNKEQNVVDLNDKKIIIVSNK